MWIAASSIPIFQHMRAHGWVHNGCEFSGSAGRCRGMGRPVAQAWVWNGQRVRSYGSGGYVFRFMRMSSCAPVCLSCPKDFEFVFAGLCASRVGAADPMRTDVAPLDGTAFTTGQGWRSASLVTVEDEAPALDTVVVDPQGAIDTNVQVASESESAGVFTVTIVHVHCAHGRRHRDALHTCAHRSIHTYARAFSL